MSTFTCAELANAWGWGACNCAGNPTPATGSVSNSGWPNSVFSTDWEDYERNTAKWRCCEIACEAYASSMPLNLLQGTEGQGAQPIGPITGGKRRLGQTAMFGASGRRFRNQVGKGIKKCHEWGFSPFSGCGQLEGTEIECRDWCTERPSGLSQMRSASGCYANQSGQTKTKKASKVAPLIIIPLVG